MEPANRSARRPGRSEERAARRRAVGVVRGMVAATRRRSHALRTDGECLVLGASAPPNRRLSLPARVIAVGLAVVAGLAVVESGPFDQVRFSARGGSPSFSTAGARERATESAIRLAIASARSTWPGSR